MPTDPIESMDSVADAKFHDLENVSSGASAPALQLIQQLQYDKAAWRGAAGAAESTINDLLDNPDHQFMSVEEKTARIAKATRDFNEAHAVSERTLRSRLTILESVAIADAESDLELAPAADRALIRDDIRAAIAARPKDCSVAGVLYELATSDPKKYAAEMVKDDFAVRLLKSVGEAPAAANLRAGIIDRTPGSSKQAQAGRALLKAIPQVIGAIGGVKYAQAARVEKAAKPRPSSGYQLDTLIPRR